MQAPFEDRRRPIQPMIAPGCTHEEGNVAEGRKKVSLGTLFEKMNKGEPITMLTCYDYPTACFMEQAGLDILLVAAYQATPRLDVKFR